MWTFREAHVAVSNLRVEGPKHGSGWVGINPPTSPPPDYETPTYH